VNAETRSPERHDERNAPPASAGKRRPSRDARRNLGPQERSSSRQTREGDRSGKHAVGESFRLSTCCLRRTRCAESVREGDSSVERRREPFLPPASVPEKGSSTKTHSARRTSKVKASKGSSPFAAVRGIDTRVRSVLVPRHECRSRQNALGLREAHARRWTGRKPGRRFRARVNGSLLSSGNGLREKESGSSSRDDPHRTNVATRRTQRGSRSAFGPARDRALRLSVEGTHDRRRECLSRGTAETVSAFSRSRLWRGRHGSQKR